MADTIFSRNRYGPYVKAYVSPVQPDTVYQQTANAQFVAAGDAYAATSDAFKKAWDNLAARILAKSFHDGYRKSFPRGLFIKAYMNQYYAGLTPDPQPDFPITNGFEKVSLTFSAFNSPQVKLVGGTTTSNYSYILKSQVQSGLATRSINTVPAVFFKGGSYIANTDILLLSDWETRFGSIDNSDSARLFCTAEIIHSASGLPVGKGWDSTIGPSVLWSYDFISTQPWATTPGPDGWAQVGTGPPSMLSAVAGGIRASRSGATFGLNKVLPLSTFTSYNYRITLPTNTVSVFLRFGIGSTPVFVTGTGVQTGIITSGSTTLFDVFCGFDPSIFVCSDIALF